MLATTENSDLNQTIPTDQAAFAPRIAIIIPVFKHSVLVAEAIACALAQDTDLPLVIVIVNDGCKFSETDRVSRDFALAYPRRVVYLYRPNGGLSAARNTGIDFALATWDSVEAIYLLDADNRISPHTIERSHQVLLAEPDLGWVYPTIDMFGKEDDGDFDYRGEYSMLRHLRFNTCEAGSMIRRQVFDRGCRYDESMKLGFEDWEFWWQAIATGFKGKHIPESGFQYRKRFASMLSGAKRDEVEIVNYMRRKHCRLLSHNNIIGWEHEAAPRYAIFLGDTQRVILTSDPTQQEFSLSSQAFFDHYHRGRIMPVRYHRPYFLVFSHSQVLNCLEQQKLLQGVFWRLEHTQAQADFSVLHIETNSTETLVMEKINTASDLNSDLAIGETEHLIMTNVGVMDRCLAEKQSDWLYSLICSDPLPEVVQLQIKMPPSSLTEAPPSGCADDLISTFKALGAGISENEPNWDWHNSYLPYRTLMYEDARLALDCAPIYPKVCSKLPPSQRQSQRQSQRPLQIGFVLSILEFGGVEKVALNLARVFQEAGWSVHLFIFGTRMQQLPEWAQIFTTINFYHESSMSPWQGDKYMGSKGDTWSAEPEQMAARGLLGWLDGAINFHNATANNIMGQLRRSGVKTLTSLHVHDLSPWQRPVGHTYLALGSEHAYDFILPCSHNMADWCQSMGIPQDKIVVVPNAAGYPLTSAEVAQVMHTRSQRNLGQNSQKKLKILFIGRFDRQKGLNRLVATVKISRELQLPMEWRLVGKNILGSDRPDHELMSLADIIEPPALSTAELTQLYSWADVLFLPSYWEGLPLTILEAMRLGVVVCASEVGAVAEAIAHNQTGFVIPNDYQEVYVKNALALLQKLATIPLELRRISLAAASQASQLSWKNSSSYLITTLEESITSKKYPSSDR